MGDPFASFIFSSSDRRCGASNGPPAERLQFEDDDRLTSNSNTSLSVPRVWG
jgi:hypothetical protein